MPVDYSKWADIADSDDEQDVPETRTPAGAFGHELMTTWLTEAAPGVSKDEIAHIVRFVELSQPPLGTGDNRSMSAQILKFAETERPVRTAPLVAAVAAAQIRDLDSLPASLPDRLGARFLSGSHLQFFRFQ